MAGRNPKPTHLRLIEGNKGKRSINANEPTPDLLEDLTAPAHLSADAAKVWGELAPKYRRAMLLTELDAEMLELASTSIANYRTATAKADEGPVCTNPTTGSMYPNPWVNMAAMYFKQAKTALESLGGSPVARVRLSVNPQSDLFDSLESFIKGAPKRA